MVLVGVKDLAHRAAWRLWRGPIPSGLCVCHKCDNPVCVNPSHLFVGTRSDNMKDCSRKGRLGGTLPSGEQNSHAKLKTLNIRAIKRLRGLIFQKDIAILYGVTPTDVRVMSAVSIILLVVAAAAALAPARRVTRVDPIRALRPN